MPSASVDFETSNYNLYDLTLIQNPALRDPVILKATPARDGAKDLPALMDTGDETFNLSAVLGNDNGAFVWGSSGFEQSAKNIQIEVREGRRYLTADLQDSTGAFKPGVEEDLDAKIELLEYVHPKDRQSFYKLGMKQPPPPLRTLVLCFDGTSNHFSNQNTNVVKFMELLKKTDPERQMVYYQTGVGTYAPPGVMTDAGLSIAEKADEGVAWYLYQHVMDGYKYLVETYQIGDRISIFGFSRGAFTARALAGMVHCVGLLPRHNLEHIPFAYDIYKNADDKPKAPTPTDQPTPTYGALSSPVVPTSSPFTDPTSTPNGANGANGANGTGNATTAASTGFENLSLNSSAKAKNVNPEDFKQVFCLPVAIDFVGVWDTVASVGSVWPKMLPWIDYNPSIRNFRQALALDERRANFIPSVWDHSRTNPDTQTVLEVWFKGGHTDVGGGAPSPTRTATQSQQSMLSNITLRWMVRQCLDVDTGIIFDHRPVRKYREAKVLEGRPKGEDDVPDFVTKVLEASKELDGGDIGYPPYDAMEGNVGWHLLEWLPSEKPVPTENGLSTTRVPNMYKPRSIYRQQPHYPIGIHTSVVDFLETQSPTAKDKYVPRAIWHGYDKGEMPWIEDGLKGSLDWESNAIEAMPMDWKETQGWGDWIKGKVGGLFGKS